MTTHDAQSYGEHLGLDIGYIYIFFFLIFDSNILITSEYQIKLWLLIMWLCL